MKRRIGNTPFETGRLALGCVTFGREIGEEASFRIMDYALEHGITLFDTAEVYGGGASESIIGRWLRVNGTRRQVVLQTKTLSHAPEAVAASLQGSLDRLQTERIDLYLMHRVAAEMPVERTLEAMASGIRGGRIGAIGCSNATAEQLRRALELSAAVGVPLQVTQPPYNLAAREIESEFLPLCRREGIGVVAYSPLGAGFLSGKYMNSVPPGSRFDVIPGHADIYFTPRNFAIVRELAALAERTRVPMVRLAMAWALRNPDLTAVLAGARSTAHLDNALAALEMQGEESWFEEMDRFSRPE